MALPLKSGAWTIKSHYRINGAAGGCVEIVLALEKEDEMGLHEFCAMMKGCVSDAWEFLNVNVVDFVLKVLSDFDFCCCCCSRSVLYTGGN